VQLGPPRLALRGRSCGKGKNRYSEEANRRNRKSMSGEAFAACASWTNSRKEKVAGLREERYVGKRGGHTFPMTSSMREGTPPGGTSHPIQKNFPGGSMGLRRLTLLSKEKTYWEGEIPNPSGRGGVSYIGRSVYVVRKGEKSISVGNTTQGVER